jgi:hypothetical protein
LVPSGSLPPNNQGSLKSSTEKIKPIKTVIETSKAQNVSDIDNFLAACRFAGTVLEINILNIDLFEIYFQKY